MLLLIKSSKRERAVKYSGFYIFFKIIFKSTSYFEIKKFEEDAQEEFGWKLVHGDVFRPPRNAMFLSVFVGSGCQVLFMVAVTLGISLSRLSYIILKILAASYPIRKYLILYRISRILSLESFYWFLVLRSRKITF